MQNVRNSPSASATRGSDHVCSFTLAVDIAPRTRLIVAEELLLLQQNAPAHSALDWLPVLITAPALCPSLTQTLLRGG